MFNLGQDAKQDLPCLLRHEDYAVWLAFEMLDHPARPPGCGRWGQSAQRALIRYSAESMSFPLSLWPMRR